MWLAVHFQVLYSPHSRQDAHLYVQLCEPAPRLHAAIQVSNTGKASYALLCVGGQ